MIMKILEAQLTGLDDMGRQQRRNGDGTKAIWF